MMSYHHIVHVYWGICMCGLYVWCVKWCSCVQTALISHCFLCAYVWILPMTPALQKRIFQGQRQINTNYTAAKSYYCINQCLPNGHTPLIESTKQTQMI